MKSRTLVPQFPLRHGGFVRVQDPSVGFYIGGSSIREMNGLYGRVERRARRLFGTLRFAAVLVRGQWVARCTHDSRTWAYAAPHAVRFVNMLHAWARGSSVFGLAAQPVGSALFLTKRRAER